MDLGTRLPSFAKILVLSKFCFSPAHSAPELTKAQHTTLGTQGQGHRCPCAVGKLRHDVTNSSEQAAGAGLRASAGAAPQHCGEARVAPQALPGQVCLSHGPFLLLLPLGLAAMLQSRPIGRVSGAVLTHQPPTPSQGCLPASPCRGCGQGQPMAISLLHVASESAHCEHWCMQVPDIKGHQ